MDCQHDGLEKFWNNDAREASRVDGAMFLKASLHGVERSGGDWGRSPPRHLQTQVTGSERVHMASGDLAPPFANRLHA